MLAAPPAAPRLVFAEPTPLGLIGLAIGCAALVPIAFGLTLTPAALETAAIFCLLFGAGCQMLAGLMNLANGNLYGGTLFTAFAFAWTFNWWTLEGLASGVAPDHAVVLATEICSLVVFVALTYGFGFYSKVLFAFLVDIDLLYVAKLAKAATGLGVFDTVVALCTVALAALALWIAFALMINPAAGRAVFPVSGPLFRAAVPPPAFDFAARRAIFDALYAHFRERAYAPLPIARLAEIVAAAGGPAKLEPDLHYLAERGAVALLPADGAPSEVRLRAEGIDLYEQRVLGKVG